MQRRLYKHKQAIDKAHAALNREVERLALETVRRVAAQNPGKRATFISAMGRWFFELEGENITPEPLYSDIDLLEREYGYGVVLPVVFIEVKDGEVSVKHDW